MTDRLSIAAIAMAIAGVTALSVLSSTRAPAATTASVSTSIAASASLPSLVDAPDFTEIGNWINSPPLNIKGLRGKVVLVDFWTFACVNCANTLPYVKEWHTRYASKGLVVVGVHTPEYGFERDIGNLNKAVSRFGITYPVAQDNRYGTWNAYGNQYWPALYLIDKHGKVVYSHFGEGRYKETEAEIQRLLAEPS